MYFKEMYCSLETRKLSFLKSQLIPVIFSCFWLCGKRSIDLHLYLCRKVVSLMEDSLLEESLVDVRWKEEVVVVCPVIDFGKIPVRRCVAEIVGEMFTRDIFTFSLLLLHERAHLSTFTTTIAIGSILMRHCDVACGITEIFIHFPPVSTSARGLVGRQDLAFGATLAPRMVSPSGSLPTLTR